MSYIRGVVTTEDGNLGLLQSVNYNTSVEEAIEKDARVTRHYTKTLILKRKHQLMQYLILLQRLFLTLRVSMEVLPRTKHLQSPVLPMPRLTVNTL